MSLILEALRKSEAERQRGRAPGLFVEQQALRRHRGQVPAWAFYAAGAVLLAVLAAWAWREAARDDSAAAAEVPTDPSTEPATTTPAPSPGVPYPGTASAPTAPVPTAGDAPTPTGSAFGAGVGATAAATDPGNRSATAIPASDPALAPAARPMAEPDPVATVDTAAMPGAPAGTASPSIADPVAPPPAHATGAPAPPTPAVATSPAPANAAPPTVAPPTPSVEPLPRLADVPASERGTLPPLRLSMHVYSDEPAGRFIILDGRRLGEGAAPAAGVVVEEIRRDGAVLAINGRRVLVARP